MVATSRKCTRECQNPAALPSCTGRENAHLPRNLVSGAIRHIRRLQHLLGPHANKVIAREVPPENLAVRIQQKFSWARDIGTAHASVRVHESHSRITFSLSSDRNRNE